MLTKQEIVRFKELAIKRALKTSNEEDDKEFELLQQKRRSRIYDHNSNFVSPDMGVSLSIEDAEIALSEAAKIIKDFILNQNGNIINNSHKWLKKYFPLIEIDCVSKKIEMTCEKIKNILKKYK